MTRPEALTLIATIGAPQTAEQKRQVEAALAVLANSALKAPAP